MILPKRISILPVSHGRALIAPIDGAYLAKT